MRTLIIYDNTGEIFIQMTGTYPVPDGLQHMEIEIPQGKIVTGVNMTVTPHQPIFIDTPKSETQHLKEELDDTRLALAELAEALFGGV